MAIGHEIKVLTQGKLTIKTVAMGTIDVEWRKISSLSSDKFFEIVLADHRTFYGRFENVDSARNALISFSFFEETVPLMEIVNLDALSKKFWKNLDGNLNVGFSYTQATKNLQTSSYGEVSYRTNRTSHELYFSNYISITESSESEKQDGGYRFQLFYKHRIYNALDLRWERNTELGIDSRLITSLTAGFNPIETNYNVFSIEAGGSVNREFSTENTVTNNVELLVSLGYDLFIYKSSKVFFKIRSETYPSLTVTGRVRSNHNTGLSWEVFKDFTLAISYWGNFDSKPVNTTGLTYDWGNSLTIGYNF